MEKKREPKTKNGRQLLDAMMVEKNQFQNTSMKMEALYSSMSAVQLAEIIYKAIQETYMGFGGINYLEGAKYITMNSAAQECMISPQWRILPVRSSNMGSGQV